MGMCKCTVQRKDLKQSHKKTSEAQMLRHANLLSAQVQKRAQSSTPSLAHNCVLLGYCTL